LANAGPRRVEPLLADLLAGLGGGLHEHEHLELLHGSSVMG
jgi:hypothetical protein